MSCIPVVRLRLSSCFAVSRLSMDNIMFELWFVPVCMTLVPFCQRRPSGRKELLHLFHLSGLDLTTKTVNSCQSLVCTTLAPFCQRGPSGQREPSSSLPSLRFGFNNQDSQQLPVASSHDPRSPANDDPQVEGSLLHLFDLSSLDLTTKTVNSCKSLKYIRT